MTDSSGTFHTCGIYLRSVAIDTPEAESMREAVAGPRPSVLLLLLVVADRGKARPNLMILMVITSVATSTHVWIKTFQFMCLLPCYAMAVAFE
jgi:hypothetical protein